MKPRLVPWLLGVLIGISGPIGCHLVLGIEPFPEPGESAGTSTGGGMGGGSGMSNSAGGGDAGGNDCTMVNDCNSSNTVDAAGAMSPVQVTIGPSPAQVCVSVSKNASVEFKATSPCKLRGGIVDAPPDPDNPIEMIVDGGILVQTGMGALIDAGTACVPFYCENEQDRRGAIFTQ